MKLTYDPRHNIAYLRLHEKTAQVETIRVSDELNVDIAPDQRSLGRSPRNRPYSIASTDFCPYAFTPVFAASEA